MTTEAPSWARRLAIAAPIDLDEPVTTAGGLDQHPA